MAKQPRKPAAPATPKTAAAETAILTEAPPFFQNTRLQGWLLFAFAFLLYANTLGHQWAQDDAIVITDNMFTQRGIAGIGDIFTKDSFFGFFKSEGKANLVSGGRYRPLTSAMFAVVYQAVGNNPLPFHLLTVLLFAATCLLLYRTLLLLLRDYRGTGYAAMVAWMAALLFAAHPVHTEVVANVKGCDEIVTLLGSLGALWLTIKAFDTGKSVFNMAATGVFFLALLSKENAATFVAVVPLALWCFRGASVGAALRHTAWLFGAFLVFFGIRSAVLPEMFGEPPLELMNNPYVKVVGTQWVPFAPGEKFGTIFYTLLKYIQLLVVPHPLTHDYYPRHIDIMNFTKPAVLLSLAVHIGLIWYAFGGILRGKRDLVRFGVAFYLLTLSIVSNLVFPIGTNMGERFLFMPSVGFVLIVAAFLMRLTEAGQGFDLQKIKTPLAVLGVVVALFSLKTVLRNPAWYDDERLFFTDLETSSRSAKIQNACGGVCCTNGTKETDPAKRAEWFRKSVNYLSKCLEIHPTYKDALLNRGISYYHLQEFDKAIADFRYVTEIAPNEPKGPTNLAIALRDGGKFYGEKKGDLATALRYLNESVKLRPDDNETLRLLGVANGVARNHAEAIRWFTRLTELAPENAVAWYDLGIAYGAAGDIAKAKELEAKAFQMNPNVLEERAGTAQKK